MSASVTGRDFTVFTAALRVALAAGANPMPVGGNEFVLPDGAPWGLLQTLAGTGGLTVSTDEPEPVDTPRTGTARAAQKRVE